jgi:hypothetical protein
LYETQTSGSGSTPPLLTSQTSTTTATPNPGNAGLNAIGMQPSATSVASAGNTQKNISIILPGDKKPKMISSGKKPDIKADVDVAKLIHKNKEEQNSILDLSKNNVTHKHNTQKDLNLN